MSKERIQKVLSQAGVASRRKIERMLRERLIKVNNKIITKLGFPIDPEKDVILLNNKPILIELYEKPETFYLLLNKPTGIVSTTKDEHNRKCILDLIDIDRKAIRIYPIGRLDYDAEGAILLTNDGDLTNKLLQPKNNIKKKYMIKVKGFPLERELDKLRKGIYIKNKPTGRSKIEIKNKTKKNTWIEIILTKGQNQQIKEMFWRIKHPVNRIVRISFAGISIESLPVGKYRFLTKIELNNLKKLTSLKD